MRFVLISDTHEKHRAVSVPYGDVLIHAGDFTIGGESQYIVDFNDWLGDLPHPFKVVIPGNHELGWSAAKAALITNAKLLVDSGCEYGGFKFWGSPFTPTFFDWAFMLPRGKSILQKWLEIPHDTDVLITHGPPMGILDTNPSGEHCGCEDLALVVDAIKPKLHVFGHIHDGYGARKLREVTYVNASSVDERYRATHAPIVVEL